MFPNHFIVLSWIPSRFSVSHFSCWAPNWAFSKSLTSAEWEGRLTHVFYMTNYIDHLLSARAYPQWGITSSKHTQFSVTSSVQFSHSVISDSLPPQGLQQTRLPCPLPTPRACSNSCPLSQWWHPAISVVPFSSCLWSSPASGSFQMSQFFPSSGQSIGISVSASVLPKDIQDWFPLGLTGWISLLSKRLSRVFSNTTVQKH